MAEIDVCPIAELPPGTVRIVEARPLLTIGVYNCDGELFALEDRCSHDDGPLCEGDFDCGERVAVCPRHGARFDITTGRALTLPAYLPVETYPVRVRDDGMVVLDSTVYGLPYLPSSTAVGIHSDLPRKGGGPDVTDSSSTGSGGTSG